MNPYVRAAQKHLGLREQAKERLSERKKQKSLLPQQAKRISLEASSSPSQGSSATVKKARKI